MTVMGVRRGPTIPMCDDRKTGPARAQGTRRAGRQARGYPSDLTEAQWQVIVPHLPPEVPGRRGRPRVWPVRRIIEAILYVDRTGCAWRYLPADFPPWRGDGTLTRLRRGDQRLWCPACRGISVQVAARA